MIVSFANRLIWEAFSLYSLHFSMFVKGLIELKKLGREVKGNAFLMERDKTDGLLNPVQISRKGYQKFIP